MGIVTAKRVRKIRSTIPHMRLLCLFTCLALVTACAPISRESCIKDSAYDIGFAAAMDNAERNERFQRISKICAKQNRFVDLAEFELGFDAGAANFCNPDNGYRWGRDGRSYNGICANADFSMAYEEGLKSHNLEKRQAEIRTRLETIRNRLATIADLLENDKSLNDERRRALRLEEDRLLMERSDLIAEQQSLGFG